MNITVEDVRFWEAKRKHPKWWHDYKVRVRVTKPLPDFSIDRIINGHAGIKVNYETHNLVEVLKSARNRGEKMSERLYMIMMNSEGSDRRRTYAYKWWCRITLHRATGG